MSIQQGGHFNYSRPVLFRSFVYTYICTYIYAMNIICSLCSSDSLWGSKPVSEATRDLISFSFIKNSSFYFFFRKISAKFRWRKISDLAWLYDTTQLGVFQHSVFIDNFEIFVVKKKLLFAFSLSFYNLLSFCKLYLNYETYSRLNWLRKDNNKKTPRNERIFL